MNKSFLERLSEVLETEEGLYRLYLLLKRQTTHKVIENGNRKEYDKAYYQVNKAKKKAYYEANKEKLKPYRNAYWKKYYQANKEKRKVYRKANKEKILEYQRAYYKKKKKEKENG